MVERCCKINNCKYVILRKLFSKKQRLPNHLNKSELRVSQGFMFVIITDTLDSVLLQENVVSTFLIKSINVKKQIQHFFLQFSVFFLLREFFSSFFIFIFEIDEFLIILPSFHRTEQTCRKFKHRPTEKESKRVYRQSYKKLSKSCPKNGDRDQLSEKIWTDISCRFGINSLCWC